MFHVEQLKRCEECPPVFEKSRTKNLITMQQIEGNIIDIHNREISPGTIVINEKGIITAINKNTNNYDHYICPGFIDAHVHIESSMLIPEEFSKLAIRRGTIAVINDPHEIANVMGVEGINYMIENSAKSDIKTFFTIPSCVPATPFDSSGSIVSSLDVENMAASGKFIGLSEMMNVPGVLHHDPEVMAKLETARRYGLKIDGHAPGLSGSDLKQYVLEGISTDHEFITLQEAKEKIAVGMKILIREGSAAKNYETLKPLIASNPDDVMFCTDDSHPDDLLFKGEIDKLVRRAVKDGFDLFDTLKIASYNPVRHYKIDVGTIKIGDPADFIKIRNLESFETLAVYIGGIEKFNLSKKAIIHQSEPSKTINNFQRAPISLADIAKPVEKKITCIKVLQGELITERIDFTIPSPTLNFESDTDKDILKIVYLNRYHDSPPKVAFISGFGIKKGAFATSISHDSHNIIAVGCVDKDILDAINTIIEGKGGLVVKNNDGIKKLPLPFAGIMTCISGEETALGWSKLIHELKNMGCTLQSPFMTLSFMSLIVIPQLKIGEQGLFDFNKLKFIDA